MLRRLTQGGDNIPTESKRKSAPELSELVNAPRLNNGRPQRNRRNSMQKVMQTVGLVGLIKTERTEELEGELRRLRAHSQDVIQKNWADIERVEQEKNDILARNEDLEQEVHDLRQKLQEEQEKRLAMNLRPEIQSNRRDTAPYNSNMPFLNEMETENEIKDRDLDLRQNLRTALDITSKPLFQKMQRVSLDLTKTCAYRPDNSAEVERQCLAKLSQMEFEKNCLVSDYEKKISKKDSAIATLEKTIDILQEKLDALQEQNDKHVGVQPNHGKIIKEQNDEIETLKLRIVSLEKSLKNNQNEMKKNLTNLSKKSEKKGKEIKSLLSVVTKQKQYVALLTNELKSLKEKEKSTHQKGSGGK